MIKIKKDVNIRSVIKTKTGKTVATSLTKTTIEPGVEKTILQAPIKIGQPILWSPESPYLYTVTTDIIDEAGKIIDRINTPLGLRWFQFDGEKGFSLNGKPYKLVGTSRHQDHKGMGNAVPDKLAIKDIELLKKMGGNFLRVAHYPQDPAVLKACDSIGLLASVEIPIVNEITETDSFYLNCRNMQVEMIRQNYNHPSVIIWCYMNEVLLRPHYNDDKTKQKKYFEAITSLARSLDSITRKEDPFRYTMIAHHGDYNKYNNAGLNDISMIVGWNLYSGWYGAKLSDFPAFLDSFHKRHPQMPMVVSEYGADADPRINSLDPARFDKSVEYTTSFHQYYLKEMLSRPFVSGAMIWNLADFNSETRNESMPHINNKGLLDWDRTPKDPYYYYKAILSKKPFVKILGQHKMAGVAHSKGAYCMRVIQVASNLNELTLRINGKSMGKQTIRNGLCEWQVPLMNGVNNIEVKTTDGKVVSDKLAIEFDLLPNKFADTSVRFHQLNILLGSKRSFIDEKKQVWIPDQKYEQGSWGYIDGRNFKAPGNSRLPYGTDKNISGSADDPIYQTQQIGLSKYKLDVPAGEYEVTFHFAELLGGQVKGSAYNLADPDRIEPNGKRIFAIYINNKLVLDKFNIADDYGTATAVSKKIKITVADNKGMEIVFNAIEGEPVLNALQIQKIETKHHQSEVTPNK
jgi:beta-galactosidase